MDNVKGFVQVFACVMGKDKKIQDAGPCEILWDPVKGDSLISFPGPLLAKDMYVMLPGQTACNLNHIPFHSTGRDETPHEHRDLESVFIVPVPWILHFFCLKNLKFYLI